nr:hypothetical protein [Tanacetum cinerariifolium]
PGVSDVPSDDSKEELSWNSSDDEDVSGHEEGNKSDESDEEHDEGSDEVKMMMTMMMKIMMTMMKRKSLQRVMKRIQSGKGGDEVSESEGESEKEETRQEEEESFDPIPRTPEESEDESNDEEDQELRLNSHVTLTLVNPDGPQESSSVSSFVTIMLNPTSDVGVESFFTTTSSSIVSIPTPTPIMTPSTIATITTSNEAPIPPPTIPSIILKNLPTFNLAFRFDERLRSLETYFSEYRQTNLFVDVVSAILGIVQQYMTQQMTKAVREAVQIQTNRLQDLLQRENDEFLRNIDENMKKIIKGQVKNQVKEQVSRILPRIEESVNATLERSDEQRKLYKALVEAYDADKAILDTYGDSTILKTPEGSEEESNDEEDPELRLSEEARIQEEEEADEMYRDVNMNQGRGLQVTQNVEDSHVTLTPVKEQVSHILPRIEEFVNATLEAEVLTRSSHSSRTSYAIAADLSEMELKKILDTYGDSIILKRRREDDDQEGPSAGSNRGSNRQKEGCEHASASTPSETATEGTGRSTTGSQSRQPSASEFSFAEEPVQTTCQMEEPPHPPRRPPSPDRAWNKTLPAAQGDAQSWISDLARQTDACSSFNELLDTPIDFSNFIMNQPTLTELEYYLEEVYKATTDQLDWVNPEGQQYPHNLLQPLSLIPDNRDYGHIKWIEDLVPRALWIQQLIDYNRHALWEVSHWGRKRQQFYGYAVNRESALDVYSKRRIIAFTELKIVEWHDYKHLDWISLSNLTVEEHFAFNVSLRMFTRSIGIKRRVEDLQLGVESYQKRLNLTKPNTYRLDLK